MILPTTTLFDIVLEKQEEKRKRWKFWKRRGETNIIMRHYCLQKPYEKPLINYYN